MKTPEAPHSRIIRLRTCLDIIGLSRSTVLSFASPTSARHDPTFPKKVRIGLRAIGWYENEIQAWVASKRT